MKKITFFIIATFIGAAVFAQNVKPYKIDFSQFEKVNGEKRCPLISLRALLQ